MAERIILGVQITNRVKDVPVVQSLLTEYGCNIKTRLGLHEVGPSHCSTTGLLILEMFGAESDILAFEEKLKKITGVVVKKMAFEE
jgi:hypothetical protein